MSSVLAEALSTTATGYAAAIDGVLDIRTVTDNRRGAAINALCVIGLYPMLRCQDPECDCIVKMLPHITDRIEIVSVSVETSKGT